MNWLVRMRNRWWFTVTMMVAYVSLFLFWKAVPSRLTFVAGALLVAGGLSVAMVVAARKGYFAGHLDLVLHALVILDVLLEGIAFELVLPLVRADVSVPALTARYHESSGFFLCTLLFSLVLGTAHYIGLRRRAANA